MDEIEKEFRDRGVLQGHTYVFRADDALAIIERCREKNREIYGIDAFIITEKTTQIMDYIDYSSGDYDKYHAKKNSDAGYWEEAKQFIKDRINEGYYFEIVYEK